MNIKKMGSLLRNKLKQSHSDLFLPVAALWFSIRVVPKPSRALYPCQQATLSLLLIKFGIIFSALFTTTSSLVNRKSAKMLSIFVLVGVLAWDPLASVYYQYSFASSSVTLLTVQDITYGFASNRVIRVHSGTATNWDFNAGYYWENINQTAVDLMVEQGVMQLTGTADPVSAWNIVLQGYSAGQKVGIKINGNDWWNSDHSEIDSIPQLTNAIIRGLRSIGVPETDIRVIENTSPGSGYRVIPSYYTNIVTAKYPNVVFQYATATNPTYGSVTGATVYFPYSPPSRRINDQIASVDHLILVPIMKAITPGWGITGSIKLMQGVIEGVMDFHPQLDRTTADNPDVLIYQNPHILNKTRLILGDGLFGTWTGQHFTGGDYGGIDDLNSPVNDVPKPWITFGNGAPNSLFFAVDPVAIDSIMYDYILRERNAQGQVAGQSMAPFAEPQILAGEAAGLGIREHGPPYSAINYIETELGATPTPIHDVAATNVTFVPTTVMKGQSVNVTVTVANQGTSAEVFAVSLYANTSAIKTWDSIALAAGATADLVFLWDTTSVSNGAYTLRAEATTVPGETNHSNNSRNGGIVMVSLVPIHDVAITDITASPATLYPGQTVNVTVTSKNEGTQEESFTITAYANSTTIASKDITLGAGGVQTENFSWNTTGALGVYQVRAEASTVPGESDTTDNILLCSDLVAVFTRPVVFPEASLTYSPTVPSVGETATFDGSSSHDSDGTIVSYRWDFGDGVKLTEPDPVTTHAFGAIGNHTVTLTVVDNDGLIDSTTVQVRVNEPEAASTFPIMLVFGAVVVAVVLIAAGLAVFYFLRKLRT